MQTHQAQDDDPVRQMVDEDGVAQVDLSSAESSWNNRVLPAGFKDSYRLARKFTLTGRSAMLGLYEAVQYVGRNNIPGAFVECGVWRGGSVMTAALSLRQLGKMDRELWLFDTFEGIENMPAPDSMDIESATGRSATEAIASYGIKDASLGFGTLDDVQANVGLTGYPLDLVHIIKRNVADTQPVTETGPIAFLRLDTDWYSSTKCELENLYPRLSKGGVLIIDDYGHFEGARKAVDEYFESIGEPVFLNRVNYTVRLAVKISEPRTA